MSYNKDWSDQPDCVIGGERIARFGVGDELVSIIEAGSNIYVTVGNLFRSQTVRVDSYKVAFQVCALIGKSAAKLPLGAWLVE